MEFVNQQIIEGDLLCHISYSYSSVLVSCYSSGNVLPFPIIENGILQVCTVNDVHQWRSINNERQKYPHAHQYVSSDVFVSYLGIDSIKSYCFNEKELVPRYDKDVIIAS